MRYTFSRESFVNPSQRIHMQKVFNTKSNAQKFLVDNPQRGVRLIRIPKGYVYDVVYMRWTNPEKMALKRSKSGKILGQYNITKVR